MAVRADAEQAVDIWFVADPGDDDAAVRALAQAVQNMNGGSPSRFRRIDADRVCPVMKASR